jgi:hypothetical protein
MARSVRGLKERGLQFIELVHGSAGPEPANVVWDQLLPSWMAHAEAATGCIGQCALTWGSAEGVQALRKCSAAKPSWLAAAAPHSGQGVPVSKAIP